MLLAFRAEAYPISERQLERWRNHRLLPAIKQVGDYSGSETWHPPETFRQSVAIHRARCAGLSLDKIGPLLWVAGFEVGEVHWAPRLKTSEKLWQRLGPIASWISDRSDRVAVDRTLGDTFREARNLTGAMAKAGRRLGPDQKAALVNIAVDVASGQFEGFDFYQEELGQESFRDVIEAAVGFAEGENHPLFGKTLTFAKALQSTLVSIATTRFDIGEPFSTAEIRAARDDVRNALKIAVCLNDAFEWIYGRNALGLGFLAFIAKTLPVKLIFAWTVAFARMRRQFNEFYPSDEIAALAEQAEMVWLMSTYVRDIRRVSPALAEQINAKFWKHALSSSTTREEMLSKMGSVQFPEADFRPWQSWQKLSKTTMSRGLLVMSIGCQNQLTLAEVIGYAKRPLAP